MKLLTDEAYSARQKEFATGSLSTIMRLALEDLEEVEADKKYQIDMGTYHLPERQSFIRMAVNKGDSCAEAAAKFEALPKTGPLCHVCAAGAVMARTFQAPIDKEVFPEHYPLPVKGRLRAIDNVRLGNFYSAAMDIDSDIIDESLLEDRGVVATGVATKFGFDFTENAWTEYEDDPEEFKANIRKMIAGLQEVGL
jgi:hypothetical protein